jgi:hypothetical protein
MNSEQKPILSRQPAIAANPLLAVVAFVLCYALILVVCFLMPSRNKYINNQNNGQRINSVIVWQIKIITVGSLSVNKIKEGKK